MFAIMMERITTQDSMLVIHLSDLFVWACGFEHCLRQESSNFTWFSTHFFLSNSEYKCCKTHSLLQMRISAMIEDSENQRIPVCLGMNSRTRLTRCFYANGDEIKMAYSRGSAVTFYLRTRHSLQRSADATLASADDTEWPRSHITKG